MTLSVDDYRVFSDEDLTDQQQWVLDELGTNVRRLVRKLTSMRSNLNEALEATRLGHTMGRTCLIGSEASEVEALYGAVDALNQTCSTMKIPDDKIDVVIKQAYSRARR